MLRKAVECIVSELDISQQSCHINFYVLYLLFTWRSSKSAFNKFLVTTGGRIVFVNAELHTLADGASPDYKYSGAGDQGYCR